MGSVRRELIDSCIDQLRTSLRGVRPLVAEKDLRALHQAQSYTSMVGEIKHLLGLKVRMQVGYAKNDAQGMRNAPAWIEVPHQMPLFGTREFENLRLTMYIRKSFLEEAPFEAVTCVISHELSHVVLEGIRHTLRSCEEAVDLTAMMLGFRHFFVRGSHYPLLFQGTFSEGPIRFMKSALIKRGLLPADETTRIGYLTREEVLYANAIMG